MRSSMLYNTSMLCSFPIFSESHARFISVLQGAGQAAMRTPMVYNTSMICSFPIF
jgi:hypothetical protein